MYYNFIKLLFIIVKMLLSILQMICIQWYVHLG